MDKGHIFLDPLTHSKTYHFCALASNCLAVGSTAPPLIQLIALANFLNMFKKSVRAGGTDSAQNGCEDPVSPSTHLLHNSPFSILLLGAFSHWCLVSLRA